MTILSNVRSKQGSTNSATAFPTEVIYVSCKVADFIPAVGDSPTSGTTMHALLKTELSPETVKLLGPATEYRLEWDPIQMEYVTICCRVDEIEVYDDPERQVVVKIEHRVDWTPGN